MQCCRLTSGIPSCNRADYLDSQSESIHDAVEYSYTRIYHTLFYADSSFIFNALLISLTGVFRAFFWKPLNNAKSIKFNDITTFISTNPSNNAGATKESLKFQFLKNKS